MPRLFIGIRPAPELLESIWERLAPFREKSPPKIRWVKKENLHLTLKFLGAVQEDRVVGITRALVRAAAEGPAFHADLTGVGAFPSTDWPNVVWLGMREGSRKLCDVAAVLDSDLSAQGFLPDERPFHPHLTIARVVPRPNATVARFVREMNAKLEAFGVFEVNELILFESETLPSGAIYRERVRVPFA